MISACSRAIVLACDAYNAITSLSSVMEKRVRGEEEDMLEIASAVNRFVMVGFTIAEIGALFAGATNEGLSNIKKLELLPKMANIPIQIIYEGDRIEPDARGMVKFICRGVVAPISDLCRVVNEQAGYEEASYLDKYHADPENARRPIYEQVGYGEDSHFVIVGYKPIDPKECEANIAAAQSSAKIAASLRCAMDLGIPEVATDAAQEVQQFGVELYQILADFLRQVQEPEINPNLGPNLNFLAFKRIPTPLHNDVVFSKYICPITKEPIRDPVRDPNGRTLYERSAILNWLAINPCSPVTRTPMEESDLEELKGVRALIDQRLLMHGNLLNQFLKDNQKLTEAKALANAEHSL
ncbi:MAG: U-box domain-containing protein [Chlamydiales bacterium]